MLGHPAPRVQSGGVRASAVESNASCGVRKLKKDDSEISPLSPNDASALIASWARLVNDSEAPSVEQVASGDQLSAPRAPSCCRTCAPCRHLSLASSWSEDVTGAEVSSAFTTLLVEGGAPGRLWDRFISMSGALLWRFFLSSRKRFCT